MRTKLKNIRKIDLQITRFEMPIRVFSKQDKEELKTAMLEAGFTLLKEYGMTHMSVEKITGAAGIGTSTFYNFWKNKEAYVTELIRYHRSKYLPAVIAPDILAGARKLERKDTKELLFAMVDPENSIYPYLTLEDEYKLVKSSHELKPDFEKEKSIGRMMVQYLNNTREDIDFALVANLMKLLVITSESRFELHESAYMKTVDTIIEDILDLIFKV